MNTKSNNKNMLFKDCHPIREIRKKLNLSQAALSHMIGVNQSQLSQCELGIKTLSVKAGKKLIKVAKHYGLNYHLEFIYPD
jgi:DNA-binding transcriptional regulator YiaG